MDIYAFRAEVYVPKMPDMTGFDVEADRRAHREDRRGDDGRGRRRASSSTPASGSSARSECCPAGVVRGIDVDDEEGLRLMTKDEIKGAPDYDEEHHRRDEPAYHDEVRSYYDPWGGTPTMESPACRLLRGATGGVEGRLRGRSSCRSGRRGAPRSAGGRPSRSPCGHELDHVAGLDRSGRVLPRPPDTA